MKHTYQLLRLLFRRDCSNRRQATDRDKQIVATEIVPQDIVLEKFRIWL
jgi:hypothetical protein